MELPKKIFEQVAIDPLALALSGSVYAKVIEGLKPHVPKILEEVFKKMTPAERIAAVEHAKAVAAKVDAQAKEVEKVAAKVK